LYIDCIEVITRIIIIIHTDRNVTGNTPDITVKKKTERTCTLIGVTIHAHINVVQKEAEKKLN